MRLTAWCAVALCALSAAEAVGAGGAGERALVPGSVRFGALFAVHGAPAAAGARCGAVREHYGIQRVEATLQALDEIARDPALLNGVALGAELRDSCWAPPTALRQTIELVRDAIAPHQAETRRRAHPAPSCRKVGASSSETQEADVDAGGRVPLLGVLGPGASSAAAQVQNLLQLFSIPQVSYSATSRELSVRTRFATFFRVVPSDRHQARLLVALLAAHNWTYVHAVHTDESYGQSGMAAFREEAARRGVCLAREESLRAAPSPRAVDAALRRLRAHPASPHVCVCWCEGRTARALLQGLARTPPSASVRPLRLVASDGWADRRDVVAGVERAATNALTLRIRSPYLHRFDKHYLDLTPYNNTRNPWFKEFWEEKFNCTLLDNDTVAPAAGMDAGADDARAPCSGKESLATSYTQEPKLALVVRGVYAFAHALHDMRRAICSAGGTAPGGLCAAMLPFNVSLYQRYLARVRFRAPDGGLVAFDDNGDPPPELSEYDVMSFEGQEGAWRYVRVGRWRRGALQLRGGDDAAQRRAMGVHAACGAPCGAGQWARAGEGRARCCWTCEACAPLAVVRAPPHAGCRACAPGHRPDRARTACLPVPVEWGVDGRWTHATALASGGVGLACVAACAAVFWRHRRTPVVKSASRELCSLLLAAAAVCHVAALASALRPHIAWCALVRLAAPALGGVYAAVLARTVRVARLVRAADHPAERPRALGSHAQVFTWVVLSAPGAALAAWSAVRWPTGPRISHPGRARSVLACGGGGGQPPAAQLVPLAPALALLCACVALAVRTRHLPHNLNETRWVGAATYAACVAWTAFAPLYAAAAAGARSPLLCACVSLSAGACVALALGPRVYVCTCQPERNTRAHFLTATEIRCHLGKYRPHPPNAKAAQGHTERKELVDSGCQTAASAACPRVGPCARITRTARYAGAGTDGENTEDVADVLIVLMHHYHSPPDF